MLYAVADLKRYSTIVVDPPWKIDNSTKDKLENETPHFGNTLLYAVADLKKYDLIVIDPTCARTWEK